MTPRRGMVLALTGRAGSGKNTVAEMLQRELGDEFVIVCEGFADSLKLSAAREFLQRYGTESHRDVFGWDFWVDQVIPPGGFTAPDFDLKIITDLRFENEAQRVRSVGGLVWKVDRPQDGQTDGHLSEHGIADVDRVIRNSGDLRYLDQTINASGHADDLRSLLRGHRPEATGFPGPTHMETASGRYFDVLNPRAEDVALEDIAHHLARINRYTGATGRAISVGEHSLLVASRLQALGLPASVVLHGLHHDDHEAYTGDIGRPMKLALIKLGAPIKDIERAIDEAIMAALSLPALSDDERTAVKEADEWALSAESYHHMPSQGRDWTCDGLYGPNISFDVEGLYRLRDEHGWSADTIQRTWLLWHHRLTQAAGKVAA